MKTRKALTHLSRRERQIMDVVYRTGQATATEVLAALPDPPSYSAVRAMLRVLENKGHLRHVLDTFFDGSTEKAVAALLDLSRSELSANDLDRLSELIEQAKTEGR
ncbi:MAG TPA: BlaI/MecI/CopY family transcriptional regulator [Thermoanaerobaculia bacterium]|nr:BlaI/MecI/CopY family transcriptional regulator [Thermoanaerobaculia bacterium]